MATSLCQAQCQDKVSALGHATVVGGGDQKTDCNLTRWQELSPGGPQGQPSALRGLIWEMSFEVAIGSSNYRSKSCGASQGPSFFFFFKSISSAINGEKLNGFFGLSRLS